MLRFLFLMLAANVGFSAFWTPMNPVSSIATPVSALEIAMNDNGDAIVLWLQDDSLFSSYLSSTSTTWSSPLLVATNAIGPIKVALDNSGNAAAVWLNHTTGARGNPSASYLPFGGAWTTPFSNSDETLFITMQMDSLGSAVALYGSISGSPNAGFNVLTLMTGTWSFDMANNPISTPGLSATANIVPLLIGNPEGNLVAIWVPDTFTTFYFSSRISGTWAASAVIDNNLILGTQFQPNGALNSMNEALVMFLGYQSPGQTNVSSLTATFPLGMGSWTYKGLFEGIPPVGQGTIDPSGNGVSVYGGSFAGSPLSGATLPSGAMSWGNTTTLLGAGSTLTGLDLKINPTDYALAVWRNSTANEIQFAQLPSLNGTWSSLETVASNASLPKIGTSVSGASILVWVNSPDGIYAAEHGRVQAPTNLTGSSTLVRFPLEGDLVHILRWTADSNTSVASYKVYSDAGLTHLLTTVAQSSSPQAEFHLINERATTTYYVTSVTSSGTESAASSVTIPAYR